MSQYSLIIFDMDGLMFETGRLAYKAYISASKKYDFEMSHDVYYYLTGRVESDIRKEMENLYGENMPVNDWRDYINCCKQKILISENRVYKKEGLIELLEFLKKYNYTIALASSSPREKIKKYFEMEHMPDYFDIIISGDEVSKGKPDSEIFLKACKKAEISPHQSIVLEDSAAGITAANNAEITSFLIKDNITDLPIWSGKNKMKFSLDNLQEKIHAKHEFSSLLEVKNWLIENN